MAPATDAQEIQSKWLSYFEDLEDPRSARGRLHPFLSIVMIAILATIGGARGWDDIELYAQAHAHWLETFSIYPGGLLRLIAIVCVSARIAPEALQRCFQCWVKAVIKATGDKSFRLMAKPCEGPSTSQRPL